MKQLLYYTTNDIESILRGKLAGIHAERVFIVHGKGSYVACGAANVMKEGLQGFATQRVLRFQSQSQRREIESRIGNRYGFSIRSMI